MVRRFALLVSFALLATLFTGAPAPVRANGYPAQQDTWVARGDVAVNDVNGSTAGTSCSLPDYIAGPANADVQILLGVNHTLDGGILHLCAGTYNISTTINLGAALLTLQGAGAGVTILDGGGTTQILRGDTVTVSGLAFQSGSAFLGGAIRANGSATITSSIFTGNRADPAQGGGAIVAFGSATITGSTFTDNSAGLGGAFYTNGTATVTGSTFTENIAVERGGAFYSGGTATVTDSTFTDNVATGEAAEGNDVYAQNGGTACGDSRGEPGDGDMEMGTPGIWDHACPPPVGGGGGGWTSYTLSVTTPRFGTITSDDGFACAPTDVRCARVAREGRTVTFSSSVLPGHTFVRWNGCTSVSAGTCSVTLNSETTISASYGSRWLARFVGTSTTLRASSAATVSAAATDLSSLGTGDTITITGYAKTAGAKALERAKVLRRALRAAGVTAPITITTVASSAAPAKRAKAGITVVWGVTP
jgi:predicted outer membrane repeat protein